MCPPSLAEEEEEEEVFHEQPLPKLLLWGLRHTFPYPRTSVEIAVRLS